MFDLHIPVITEAAILPVPIKPKFILPCVFLPTGFVKRSATLTEQCSMWDVSTLFIKMLSKAQLIDFWSVLQHPIKLLQYALVHTLVAVFRSGGGQRH